MTILVWRLYVQFHQQVGLPISGQTNYRGSLPIETKPVLVQPPLTRASLPLQPQKEFGQPSFHQVNHGQPSGLPGAHSPGIHGVRVSPNQNLEHHSSGGLPTTQPHGFAMPSTHTTESVWYTPPPQPTSVSPVTFMVIQNLAGTNPFGGESVVNLPSPATGNHNPWQPEFLQPQKQSNFPSGMPGFIGAPPPGSPGCSWNPFVSVILTKPANPSVSHQNPTPSMDSFTDQDATLRDIVRGFDVQKTSFDLQGPRTTNSPSTQTNTSAASNDRSVRFAPGTTVRVVDLWDPNLFTEISAAEANEYISIMERAAASLAT